MFRFVLFISALSDKLQHIFHIFLTTNTIRTPNETQQTQMREALWAFKPFLLCLCVCSLSFALKNKIPVPLLLPLPMRKSLHFVWFLQVFLQCDSEGGGADVGGEPGVRGHHPPPLYSGQQLRPDPQTAHTQVQYSSSKSELYSIQCITPSILTWWDQVAEHF